MTVVDERFVEARDEAGTAPGDRKFRPDVQGLRAVAILLVVLFHADIPGVHGGYVGVDVFFVISGFVITGVLLREHASTGKTSILAFYGRRARRIIPAASLVIVVTVLAAYYLLGSVTGRETAVDGQWASVFLANFHFAASATNYLASQRPPSALQNFWSLAVEEQFYIVYPTVFLIAARVAARRSLRSGLGVVLGATVVGSYALSISMTSSNAASAFFSPFTRAWELALGGLIAVSYDSLRRVPSSVAAGISWLGLGAILTAAFVLTPASIYPGSLVAIPVIGTGLVIAAGAAQPVWGAESILRLRPFQMLGLISYSLYLWHWPILIIATQRRGVATLPVWDNVCWLLVALVAAIGTYLVVENPIRHSGFLRARPFASVGLGCCLIASSLAVTTVAARNTGLTLGSIAAVNSGSSCHPPSDAEIASLRSTPAGRPAPGTKSNFVPQIRMAVVGDSSACTMLPGLVAIGPSYGVQIEDGAVLGCGIVSGQVAPIYIDNDNISAYTSRCQGEANDAEATAIENGHPDIVLWGSTEETNSIVKSTPHGNAVLVNGSPQWKSVMLDRIEARVAQFTASGAVVVFLLQPPFADPGNHPTQLSESDIEFQRMNTLLQDVATRNPEHVGVVNLAIRVCPSGPPCPWVVDGIGRTLNGTIRPDGKHYGPTGSLWVANWLLPRILSTAKNLR